MKRLLIAAFAAVILPGCAVVPYDAPYGTYSSAPVYTDPYAGYPGYATPAPVYGPPVYVGPPVYFGFGLHYRSGGGRHHGHRHGHGGRWRR